MFLFKNHEEKKGGRLVLEPFLFLKKIIKSKSKWSVL